MATKTLKKVLAVVLSLCMMLPLTLVSTAADEYTLTPIADILALTENSTEEFYVKGQVTEMRNTTYGNMMIKDEAGDEILVYGLYDSTGTTRYDAMADADKPVVGDTIVVLAPLTIYYSTYELKDAKLQSLDKHNYAETERVDATCTENGYIVYECQDEGCTATYTEEIAAAHDYVAGEVVEPTVDAEGYTIYTCTVCSATENRDFTDKLLPEGTTEVKFDFGENGSATHVDGSSLGTSKEYTIEGSDYKLALTSMSKVYSAYDAKGNSCIKLGTGSAAGSFSFTVPADVTSVIIEVAKYKTYNTQVTINGGTPYVISTSSNDGEYTAIELDATSTKTFTLTTTASAAKQQRAMINSITYVVVQSGCAHNYQDTITAQPTCTEPGERTWTCTLCSNSYTEKIAAAGHTYLAGETVAPTETEVGYTIYECDDCGETKNDDLVSPLGPTAPEGIEVVVFDFGENSEAKHEDGTEIKTVPADYTSGDYTLSFTALTKVYGSAFDAKGNSVLKLGTGDYTASLEFTAPEYVDTVIIWIAGYKANNTEFTVNGTTYTVELHSDDGAYYPIVIDTTETKTISLATTATIDKRALINAITYWASPACAHEYDNACDTDCNLCGEVREITHDYVTETQDATCGIAGATISTCSVCGDVVRVEIPATGNHNYTTTVVEPTCTEGGYTVYDCSICGHFYKDSETEAAGHTEVIDEAVAPTCTETGLTEGSHCSVCGTVIVEQTVVEAAGHSYDEGVVTAPTATEQGYTTYTCTVCGDSYKDNFTPATGTPSNMVQNMQLVATDTDITVTWDAYPGALSYNLYVYNSALERKILEPLSAETTSVKLSWPTQLEWGETYMIGIKVQTKEGWLETNYKYSALQLGNRIVDVSVESEGRGLRVNWQAYDGAEVYYVFVYKRGEFDAGAIARATAYTNTARIVTGIDAETDYEVRVAATGTGLSQKMADAMAIDARLDAYAPAPDKFVERGITPTKVAFSWEEIKGADYYWAYLTPTDGGKTIIKEARQAVTSVWGLTPNTTYEVQILARVIDADGVEHFSGRSEVLATVTTSDWEDIGFTAEITGSQAEFTWTVPTNAYGYYIYGSANGGATYKRIAYITDPNTTSYTYTRHKDGYTYAIGMQVQDDLITTTSDPIEAIVK